MTDHDMATMLRTHVADEPPFADGAADAVVGRGRQAVRRRRLAVVAGGVVACTLAAVLVVPRFVGSDAGSDRGLDPAIADAIASYDVDTMPTTMDERARAVLEPLVPDLGSSDFIAFDAQYQRLPEEYWEKASGLFLRYDLDEGHQVNVLLFHARSEAEGDPYRTCDRSIDSGVYLDCSVLTSPGPGGDPIVSTLEADTMKPRNRSLKGWSDQFMVVLEDGVGSVPADELWFTRTVEVVKSDTFVTVVNERVQAPDEATARERMLVPVDELVRIGLDPALVMPKPPPGENGCSQWTMPTMQVSCRAG